MIHAREDIDQNQRDFSLSVPQNVSFPTRWMSGHATFSATTRGLCSNILHSDVRLFHQAEKTRLTKKDNYVISTYQIEADEHGIVRKGRLLKDVARQRSD